MKIIKIPGSEEIFTLLGSEEAAKKEASEAFLMEESGLHLAAERQAVR